MDRVLINLDIPDYGLNYDVYIPLDKDILSIKKIIIKMLLEMGYALSNDVNLYSKDSNKRYKDTIKVNDTDITNGSKLVLM